MHRSQSIICLGFPPLSDRSYPNCPDLNLAFILLFKYSHLFCYFIVVDPSAFNTGAYLLRNFTLIKLPHFIRIQFMDSRILVTASGSYVDVGLKYPLGAPSSPINQ